MYVYLCTDINVNFSTRSREQQTLADTMMTNHYKTVLEFRRVFKSFKTLIKSIFTDDFNTAYY